MQIKTTRYHCILSRVAKIQNIATPNAAKEAEQPEHSFIAGGNINGTTILEDSLVDLEVIKLNILLQHDIAITSLVFTQRS